MATATGVGAWVNVLRNRSSLLRSAASCCRRTVTSSMTTTAPSSRPPWATSRRPVHSAVTGVRPAAAMTISASSTAPSRRARSSGISASGSGVVPSARNSEYAWARSAGSQVRVRVQAVPLPRHAVEQGEAAVGVRGDDAHPGGLQDGVEQLVALLELAVDQLDQVALLLRLVGGLALVAGHPGALEQAEHDGGAVGEPGHLHVVQAALHRVEDAQRPQRVALGGGERDGGVEADVGAHAGHPRVGREAGVEAGVGHVLGPLLGHGDVAHGLAARGVAALEADRRQLALPVGVDEVERRRRDAGDRRGDADDGLQLGVGRDVEHAVAVQRRHAGSLVRARDPGTLAHLRPLARPLREGVGASRAGS